MPALKMLRVQSFCPCFGLRSRAVEIMDDSGIADKPPGGLDMIVVNGHEVI